MLQILRENAGTLLVLAVLALLIAAIIRSLIRSRRQGHSGCGGGCQGCAMHGQCGHPESARNEKSDQRDVSK